MSSTVATLFFDAPPYLTDASPFPIIENWPKELFGRRFERLGLQWRNSRGFSEDLVPHCSTNLQMDDLEPVSHYYYSHRLKLQFWDWRAEGKPALLLVHGGLDHAHKWDWVTRALRKHFHVCPWRVCCPFAGRSDERPSEVLSAIEF